MTVQYTAQQTGEPLPWVVTFATGGAAGSLTIPASIFGSAQESDNLPERPAFSEG